MYTHWPNLIKVVLPNAVQSFHFLRKCLISRAMVRFKTEDLKLSYTKMSFIRLLSQLKIPCKREQFILTFVRVQVFTASNVWGGRGGQRCNVT